MVETRALVKTYTDGDVVTPVLKGIDMRVDSGEFVAIMGRSGAGKSTLLYQLSLLDTPTSGSINIDGREATTLSDTEKISIRLNEFGYVFQEYALLPELTAIENVSVPILMQGLSRADAEKKAVDALSRVGLEHRLDKLPSKLSGGEQQRVSISRAVAHHPKVIFADEPTANLDRRSSATVMEIFRKLHREGQTIIMVTHEEEYAREAQHTIYIDEGMIVNRPTV